ncbi:uncharacterized protein LOC120154283 [Hibiscus syriacus]|uniref:uncharacterized protein LOC120154283 n=1 Tax=Hibiscus syriacus TaxID=106335 RepID=UPI001922FE31|nr:uncharacterized protein LOC120154283 [Hibiscus syriacus]
MRADAVPFISNTFMIKDIWNDIRPKGQKATWHKLIWFPMHIPKHSLIVWMALQDRLPTRDRLQRMGISIDSVCVICNSLQETRNHLFSKCSIAACLWNSILNLNGMNPTNLAWEETVATAINSWKGKSLLTFILKIAWSAFIYTVWQERNQRIFQKRSRSAENLLNEIIDVVRFSLRGKNFNRLDSTNLNLCNVWGL